MFDDRLKNLRDKKKLTQKQVAEMLEINTRTYSSYENNEREPSSEVLILIADLFNVSVDYLLGLDESRILRQEIGRKKNEPLSHIEKQVIDKFRLLSAQGKEYVLQTLNMAVNTYKKD